MMIWAKSGQSPSITAGTDAMLIAAWRTHSRAHRRPWPFRVSASQNWLTLTTRTDINLITASQKYINKNQAGASTIFMLLLFKAPPFGSLTQIGALSLTGRFY
ncbi:MAG: hypothetical protein CTY16_02655 [Methylobacter sp.]|nr:MAG: hypothetical protein CTY16_02655 [Methylobacter sp.]